MPPLNPNWASLPGTKFEADPGGLQVAQAFLPYALQDAKAKAATKAADVAQKKADAEKVLGREVLPVAEWDIPVYQGLVKDYRKMAQDAFRMRDANPGNPAFDPMNPTSEAYNKLKDAEDALTQFQVGSAQRGKDWTAAILSYDPTKDSPADLEEKRRYYQSLTGEHMAGKVPQPVLLGNYAPEAVYNDAVSKLKTDQTAYAKPGEPGYLIEGTTEVLSDDAVKEAAFNIAHEPRQAKMTAMRIEAMPETQRTQLIKEAEANGKTPVEWLTWLDMDEKAGTKTTRGIKSDPTYMWGKGLENDMSKASLFVEQGRGFESGDLEGGVDIEDTWMSGGNDQGNKGINMPKAKVWNVWNNLNFGVKYDSKGNPINMPIKGVLKSGGKLAVVYEDPTYALPKGNEPKFKVQRPEEVENNARYKMTPWMDEKEFNTEVIGKIPDANKGILPSKDVITYAQDQYKAIKGKEGNIDLQSGGANPFDKPKGQPQATTKF